MHNRTLSLFSAALLLAGVHFSGPIQAAPDTMHDHREVIALITDDFELAETDVSDLEPGDSRTVVTDNGTTIDILRTEDAFEVYVDGELLDIGGESLGADDGFHHHLSKRIETHCDRSGDCEEHIWIERDESADSAGGADEFDASGKTKDVVIVKKHIRSE